METHDVLILDRGTNAPEERDLADTLAKRGLKVCQADWDRLEFHAQPFQIVLAGEPVGTPGAALVRSRVLTRSIGCEIAQAYDRLDLLASRGVAVVNDVPALRRARNKVLSVAILAQAGLPVPPTRSVRSLAELGDALARFKDLVAKPVYGHNSLDVTRMRLEPTDEYAAGGVGFGQEIAAYHLLRRHGELCVQKYVPNPGRDLRVLAVDGRVVACFYLVATAPDGSVKSQIHPYKREKALCSPELERQVLTAMEALGLGHASLDLLEGPDGPVFIEANPTISFWQELEQDGLHTIAGGTAGALADLVVSEMEHNNVS